MSKLWGVLCVLNRNTKPQVPGVKLIACDRHDLGDVLKDIYFDVVSDITAYEDRDIVYNKFRGAYGRDKIAAEWYLSHDPIIEGCRSVA